MEEAILRKQSAVLTEIPRYAIPEEPVAQSVIQPQAFPTLNVVLFLVTLVTTTTAGAYMAGADISWFHPLDAFALLPAGLSFSLPLMAILLAHEMGHYLTSRYHRVDTSPPYFIPAPPAWFIIGTFGAFIRMRQMPRTRRVMFDIGAAGPWAGVILAIPAVVVGLWLSDVGPLQQGGGGLQLGNSLLFLGLARIALGVNPMSVNVNLHPIAFAGWLGLFVTTLNLLPVGQLDGGHVIYALFPRRHRTISLLFVLSCGLMVIVPLALGLTFWAGWLLWGILAIALGLGHPATIDRDMPLDPRRRIAAWATVVLFIVTFSPVPIWFSPPQPKQEPEHIQEVMHRLPAHPALPHTAVIGL